MKSLTLYSFLFITLVVDPFQSFSQANVTSSAGYTVHIMVLPSTIIPSTYTCPWGYNYNIRLSYSISFTGTNIPSSLYTLQGYIACTNASHFFDLPNNGGIGTVTSTSNQWNSNTDCATATVSSLHCNSARIEINGIGIAAQTVTFPITYSLLPVQLLSFTAAREGNKVKVKWSTATEINNDYFTIERSADGSQWQEIKRINGAGNSTNILTYEWLDEGPVQGTSYYRLKQTSIDRQTSFSEVKAVQYSATKNPISIYPVPNTGHTITISGLPDYNNHELTVTSSTGVNLFTTVLSSFSVSLPGLKPGVYVVSIKDKQSGNTSNLRYVQL